MGLLQRLKMKMLMLLLFVSQHASGVEVYEGADSVLLPFEVQTNVSRGPTAAVWDRKDLNNPTIHVRLQSGDDLSFQNDGYTNRTSMRADALQTGDLSLTLRNPTVSDSGTYTCTVRRFGEDLSSTEVELKVIEPLPVWPIVLSAVLLPVVLLAVVFGVFMYCRFKTANSRKDYEPEMVTVRQWEESVTLPFKITEDLKDVKVEWKHQNTTVHVYQNGENQSLRQDQDNKDCTEMNEDPLKDKDLSLKLKPKHFDLTDGGGYTCTVCNNSGDILLQKVVILRVKGKKFWETMLGW